MDRSRDELRSAWGVTPGYWLWPVPIRILFVIDGRINLTSEATRFGLGFVLDTLLALFSFSVRFEVHVAKRDGTLSTDDVGSHTLTYTNFRFTNTGFSIDNYDQIWFFGDNPSDELGPVNDTDIPGGSPLDDAELKLVADWMDRGGGVFAAGDHSILGASMCSRIPRVRTMRRWTMQQGVPTKNDSARHQTLQATLQSQDRQEEDVLLQPVDVVYRRATGPLPFLRPLVPHPLLCSTHGVIDGFPDHMHEGEVIADEDVQLDLPLGIPGYDRPEYPFVIPEVVASGLPDVGPLRPRPRPRVIAFGRTTNEYFVPPVLSGAVAALTNPLAVFKRFGLVGVYDGDAVDLGRVVVDSTWHHWFSLNLVGIHESDVAAFRKMQGYYRNVGMWLAKPAQRASMLISGTWGVLNGSAPMTFDMEMGPWEIGQRIISTLELTLSPCMVEVIADPFLGAKVVAASTPPAELPEGEPSWSSVPVDLLNRAVAGSIGKALLDLALADREKRARGERTRLDPEAIRRRAVEGAFRARALLTDSIEEAATALAGVRDALTADAGPRPVDIRIPIDVRRLRVVAETLQLPDPGDPVLLERHLTLTIRIALDRTVMAYEIIEGIAVPAYDQRGSIIELNRGAGEIEVQAAESLSIEVLAGPWTSEEATPEAVRFNDTLHGDASTWIGRHVPARTQAWRLWYRIEEIGAPSYSA